ncbi:MAG: hypothetical protein DRP85_03290 [Candidatus Makaraimicrobium thalassicum]|nr:MAG: hypothetical protein DRP85_03290 [Candidatus Omnitrophota bacterium]
MSGLEEVLTCPLGSECREVRDNKLYKCAWLVELEGTHPQTGDKVKEDKCAIQWMPILMIEGNGSMNRLGASIQSMRNETVKRQDVALKVIDSMGTSND